MVGTLQRGKNTYALVRTTDKDVYQVKVGNYMGQNFGVIVNIGGRRHSAQGTGAGRCRRLDGTNQYAPARRSGLKTGATQMRAMRSTEAKREQWLKGAAIAAVASLLLLGVGQALAQTANSIEGLTVSKGSSGRTIVRFTLKAPLPNPPAGFAINNPPRIALDFPDTSNGMGRSAQEVGDPALRSVNVVQAGNRTRVVFNLNKPQSFETQIEGNIVVVTLNETATVAAEAPTVSRFAEARPGETTHALRDIDFRRGRNGEGRIIVDLSDTTTGIDIRQQGKTLVVDFIKTSLPRNLERRLDVGDFATPVMTIDTFEQAGNTRMVIEPKGLVGALGVSDRQPLHRRGQANPGRPESPDAGNARGLQGREAVAQLPERRSARRAAGDRRFHRPEHHHQRHRDRQPHAAPEGYSVGPGARHHHADQGSRHAQERQRRSDRAA